MKDETQRNEELIDNAITREPEDAAHDIRELEIERIGGHVWHKRTCEGCGHDWSEHTASGRWLCKHCFECWKCGEIVSGGGTLCESCVANREDEEPEDEDAEDEEA